MIGPPVHAFRFVGEPFRHDRAPCRRCRGGGCAGAGSGWGVGPCCRGISSSTLSRERIDRQQCVYDPEVLIVMTNAFDRACDFLPAEFRDSDQLRRKLALHIIRQVDDGESDTARLADSAILSLLRWPIRGARKRKLG